ncbi:MAG: hypothetical protein AMK69_18275 [Nitrospira bacterium SG8_3]|nr:MAG: hypothetical protein AMK69_18275 [Nitrospira bacterium SG8_3]
MFHALVLDVPDIQVTHFFSIQGISNPIPDKGCGLITKSSVDWWNHTGCDEDKRFMLNAFQKVNS